MHSKTQCTGNFFCRGTFFESAPELVKRMVTEGHTVGKSHLSSSGYVGNLGQRVVSERARCSQQFVSGSDRTGDDKVLQTTAGQIQYRESCDGKKNWGIRPFSGASPMWTGMRMHSRQRRRLMEN